MLLRIFALARGGEGVFHMIALHVGLDGWLELAGKDTRQVASDV